MTQIIIKEYGTKIFQRDFDKTEKNIVQLIKDMSLKGIISISEFKKIFGESFNETKEIFKESIIENNKIFNESLDETLDDIMK